MGSSCCVGLANAAIVGFLGSGRPVPGEPHTEAAYRSRRILAVNLTPCPGIRSPAGRVRRACVSRRSRLASELRAWDPTRTLRVPPIKNQPAKPPYTRRPIRPGHLQPDRLSESAPIYAATRLQVDMRYLRIPIFLALALVLSTAASAQPGPATAFSFLRLEASARSAALGGAFSAVYDGDVDALFYNPALLDETVHRSLSITYLNHLAGVNAGFIAHARHIEGVGTIGAGLRFVSWGELDGYDESGEDTDDFRAGDAALTLSLARSDQERFRYGASLHAIRSRIDAYAASAVAADVGIAYHLPEQRLTLSASAGNLGVVLDDLGTSDDALPIDLRVGLSKRLQYVPLLITVTGYNLNRIGADGRSGGAVGDAMRHVAVGGEFQFSRAFNVRLGYNHRRHEDLKTKSRLDMAGVGLGFGIRVSTFRFDYAFSSWSTLGGLHRFTLQTVI